MNNDKTIKNIQKRIEYVFMTLSSNYDEECLDFALTTAEQLPESELMFDSLDERSEWIDGLARECLYRGLKLSMREKHNRGEIEL